MTLFENPYLLFLGDTRNPAFAKTALGLAEWCPGDCVGQWRLSKAAIDVGLPEMSATDGARASARSLIIGVAPIGGCLGKKYTALALTKALQQKNVQVSFRATGQTGIMISGSGIALDAVVADFIAGAAESLSPDNSPEHWDIIEGQGSLFHPAYAAASIPRR